MQLEGAAVSAWIHTRRSPDFSAHPFRAAPSTQAHDAIKENHASKMQERDGRQALEHSKPTPFLRPSSPHLSLLTKFRSSLEISFCCLWLSCRLGCSHLRVPSGRGKGRHRGRQEGKSKDTVLRGQCR